VKLQEAKALKEEVDATQIEEVVLKARLGSWLEEAYVLTTSIEGKLAYWESVPWVNFGVKSPSFGAKGPSFV